MTSNGEWDGVTDRRQGERRERGPPQHVTLDGLDNGAREAVERLDQKLDVNLRLGRWLFGVGLAIALVVGGGIWRISGQLGQMTADIDNRPTDMETIRMIDSAAVIQRAKEAETLRILTNQHGQLQILSNSVEDLTSELAQMKAERSNR